MLIVRDNLLTKKLRVNAVEEIQVEGGVVPAARVWVCSCGGVHRGRSSTFRIKGGASIAASIGGVGGVRTPPEIWPGGSVSLGGSVSELTTLRLL